MLLIKKKILKCFYYGRQGRTFWKQGEHGYANQQNHDPLI